MDSTPTSRGAVFRTIASNSYRKWPAYDTASLYDRSSLDALEEDVRTIAKVWFEHGAHESVEGFVSDFPLAYFEFQPHDRYTGSTRYEMVLLIRLFLLKELHGWKHETALIEHLQQRSSLCHHLGLESIPDQATLWRSWKYRFTTELKDTVETAAETILLKADRAVSVGSPGCRRGSRPGDVHESVALVQPIRTRRLLRTAKPSRVAVDETTVTSGTERQWLYAAIDVETKLLLDVLLSPRRGTDPAAAFFGQLAEKHDLSEATFLVDGMGYLTPSRGAISAVAWSTSNGI